MPIKNQETESVINFDVIGMKKKQQIRVLGNIHNQFATEGMWVKGTLHCHLNRPGYHEWFEGAIDHYHHLGYDFIAGMDHNEIVRKESLSDLLVIPGAEISCGGHLIALGKDEIPEGDNTGARIKDITTMIGKIKQSGGISIIAHPFKSAYSWSELTELCVAGLDGFEVVNSNVRGKVADTGRADQLWHNLMREGWNLTAFGNDDAHGPHEEMTRIGADGVSQVAWTGLLIEEFSQAAVMEAIRKQRTYASEGPEITKISFKSDGKLIIECSPCVACHFRSVGGGYGGNSVYPQPGQTTSESFIFDIGSMGYRIKDKMVIVLQDRYGRRAWTSPIQIEITLIV